MTIKDGFRLDGKVIVVTGSARGIGAACADAVEDAGGVAVRLDVLQGSGVTHCDVSDRSQVDDVIDAAAGQYGRLDGIANVAAIIADGGIVDLSEETLDRIMAVNLKGVLFCCQAALRHLDRGGAIVNMSSSGGVVPVPPVAAYGMSKAAVISLTRTLAMEVAPRGIRVNAVAPGFVVTPMTTRHLADSDAADIERIQEERGRGNPMREPLHPDDLAATVQYLMTDASRHVTGQVLYVNAGALMSS
jgi:3-oxoacyl-[acyl-carrier protein] reductase